MSASSGLKGQCNVCGHMYNEHNSEECIGRDRKKDRNGKTKWVKCKNRWYICQQSHDSKRRNAYQVCHNCPSHPGGGPSGTEPGGDYTTAHNVRKFEAEWEWDPVRNAHYYKDEDGAIHYDQTGAGSSAGSGYGYSVHSETSKATSYAEHTQKDSRDSEAPLASSQERHNQDAEGLSDLTSAFEQVQISEAQSALQEPDETSIYVETYKRKDHLCFRNLDDREVKTAWSDWSEFTMDDGRQYFYWVSPKSGREFWTWELAAPGKKHRKG